MSVLHAHIIKLSTFQNIVNTTLLQSYPHYISTYPHNNIKLSTPQHPIIHTITNSIQYYIYFNQPQYHEAIITAIHTNGLTIQIPFFDISLPLVFSDNTGIAEPWVEETYHVQQLSFNYTTTIDKQLIES